MKRDEIFIQDSLSSCAAACIASIVKFYGGYVPLETIKLDTKTNKNGTNALEIVNTLRRYGFTSYGEYSKLNDIKQDILPVICHTNINGYYHFMVIYKISNNKVYVMDPRDGKKVFSFNYFISIYTNIIIHAYPNGPIKKEINNNIKIINTIFNKNIFTIIFFNFIIIIIQTLLALYIKTINIVNNNYIFIILSFILYILILIKNKLLINIDIKTNKYINNLFFNHIFKLDYNYIANKRIGEIIKKVEDLNFIKNYYFNLVYNELFNIISIIFSLIILYIISKVLLLIYSLFYFLYILIIIIYSKKIYKLNIETIESYNYYYGNLGECLNNYESIRNINDLDYLNNKINESYDAYLFKYKKLSDYSNIVSSIRGFILNIGFLIINIISLYYINKGLLTWDNYIVFISMINILNEIIENASTFINGLFHFKGLKRGVLDFLNIKESNYTKMIKTFNKIDLKDISYTYNYKVNILNNINITINKGDKILIKGNSGVGKSTLVKILSGNINNYKGKILIDNKETNNNELKNISIYVGQNEELFMGSIKENITLNREGNLNKILNICMLKDFIKNKPLNENYNILEGSTNISYGEKTRILLARALYKNPQILILDETLSGISNNLEDKILSNLISINDLTLIYITHRDKDKYFKKIINL